MASCAANILKFLKPCPIISNHLLRGAPNFTQIRNYAARKGTRERRLKLLKAKKITKKPEVKVQRWKIKEVAIQQGPLRSKEHLGKIPEDDVVVGGQYRWNVYDFAEAIQCHRETHHPTVYNQPDAYVQACIELDLTAVKKNRFVEKFSRLVPISHSFPMGEPRSVIVFCKTPELQNEAREAGANVVGDTPLIRDVEKGVISIRDFDHVLAHPNILPDIVSIRGLMKKSFPSVRTGTLGVNLKELVVKFRTGIKYTANQVGPQPDFGLINVNFGKLDMDIEHLKENLQAVLRDVHSARPKRPGEFITRVLITSAPSPEKLKINFLALVPEAGEQEDVDSEDEEENEENSRIKSVA